MDTVLQAMKNDVRTDERSGSPPDPLDGLLSPSMLAAIFAGHALLGLLLRDSPLLANLHCTATLLLAAGAAFFSNKVAPIAWCMGYIVGADVLWRMSNSTMPYETSKYAIALIGIITLVRLKKYTIPKTAFAYFFLLLPALVISYGTLSGAAFLKGVSFHISGPLSLFAAVCFFANITLRPTEWRLLLLAVIAPLVGITTIASSGTFGNPDIEFGTESVHDASGGFGPNQVSGVLGLGALLAVHYILNSRDRRHKLILFAITGLFIMQAALTFSRGGLIGAVLALAPAVFFKMRQANERGRSFVWIAVLAAFCGLVLYPLLDDFTEGALTARYTIQDLNGREGLMRADLIIWEHNSVFGVGVGGSTAAHRVLYGKRQPAHNEFTRLLAEHGLFGLAAILLIAVMAVSAVMKAPTIQERAYASSFILWSVLFCGANSMRVAAAGFMFGLAFVRLNNYRLKAVGPADG